MYNIPLNFFKLNGLGNDFFLVDNLYCGYDEFLIREFAKQYCPRHSGLGADGVLIVSSSDKVDAKMTVINADGSIPEMCGNGLRCVAYYFAERHTISDTIEIETDSGIKKCFVDDNIIAINMGQGSLDPAILFDDIPNMPNIEGIPVSMGNPHCVILGLEPIDDTSLNVLGNYLNAHPSFPNGVNVEYVTIDKANKSIKMRVYERGAGITLACGTGASAVYCAAMTHKWWDLPTCDIELDGGRLSFWTDEDKSIWMKGPVEWAPTHGCYTVMLSQSSL